MTHRILYVIRPVAGGMREHLSLLVKYLDRAEFTPLAIVADEGLLAARLRGLGVETQVLGAVGSADPRSIVRTALEVKRTVKAQKISLVHSHGYRAAIGAGVGAVVSGVPHIATIHTQIGGAKGAGIIGRLAQLALTGLSRRIIAVSREIAASFASHKVRLVCNGVEIGERLYRDRKDGKVVGVAARLSPEKGVDLFVEAAALISQRDEDVRFKVIGDGPLRKELEVKAAELGIDGKIDFLGFVDGIEEELRSIDVLVLPSRSEGQPMVILEAMAAGCPVVAADVGGVREVLSGGCGAIVPPENPSAIASAVSEVLESPGKAREMAEAGRRKVEELYSVERMAEKTMDIYREVIEEVSA